ncbi:MAG: hypothetical protein AB7V50_05940, partial [Vampirovibrionia bacterium]
ITTLKTGGKLVTLDGCYTDKQFFVKKYILDMDRGKYVRNQKEYTPLASNYFDNVQTKIIDDLLNIPYTHIVMECVKK